MGVCEELAPAIVFPVSWWWPASQLAISDVREKERERCAAYISDLYRAPLFIELRDGGIGGQMRVLIWTDFSEKCDVVTIDMPIYFFILFLFV